jgi:4-amino-4-deoxy-L-arabinose transferase-like glycosyltransferase
MILSRPGTAWRAATCASLAVYVLLSLADAAAIRPISDEAWFASPAANLVKHGYMGTSVIDPVSTGLKQIDRYTYWVMPFHLLAQAAWYKVAGVSLRSVRALSMLWGVLGLCAWFLIVRSLSRHREVALLTVMLLAVDLVYVGQSSIGRMDMMCAALGFAGIAAYLSLREWDLTIAIVVGHCFVTASIFTHPNGVFAFGSLAFLMLYFDHANLRSKHLFFAVPYLVAGAFWALYILQAPAAFASQLTANVAGIGHRNTGWMRSGRFSGLLAPWASLKAEVSERYLPTYGFAADATSGGRLKIFVLVLFVTALAGCLVTKKIRDHRGARALLVMTLLYFAGETFLNFKLYFYLVHVTPFYCAILAWWFHHSWRDQTLPRVLLAALLAAFVSIQVGTSVSVALKRQYQLVDRPAIEYLAEHAKPPAFIIGATQFAFDLGLEGNVITDDSLGYYSGRKGDFVVLSHGYPWLEKYEKEKPDVYRYIVSMLRDEYRRVYDGRCCEIFARYATVP